ncbi:MAG: dTDP-4-dehydrorhamnose reductase [Candidatus Eiseniibacteriota bacterium]
MKILVTGAGGMLAKAVEAALERSGQDQWSMKTHQALNVTAPHLTAMIGEYQPDWILHLAAFTQVDNCEEQESHAFKVNAEGARNVARAAVDLGAAVLMVSTDYVFSGESNAPYREDDPTGPLSVYGKSKLAGEEAVREVAPDQHLIVRTSWLYGHGGRNFVDTILERVKAGEPLKVVEDQLGSPTWTVDLAEGLLRLISRDARGTFHCTNRGECSWFDLAGYVLAQSGLEASLTRTDSASLGRPAPRPKYSVLNLDKFERFTEWKMPEWRSAVDRYLASRQADEERRHAT